MRESQLMARLHVVLENTRGAARLIVWRVKTSVWTDSVYDTVRDVVLETGL